MSGLETWTKVDEHFVELLSQEDEVLLSCRRRSDAAGLPPHNVTANQGQFLLILAKMVGAKRILEIGTLGGYSTVWLARSLDPLDKCSKVVTLEISPTNANVAKQTFGDSEHKDIIELIVGEAVVSLRKMVEVEKVPFFDLIFIDADKPNNPQYLHWALKLSRPGTVIVADNVVRNGAVADRSSTDASVRGVQEYLDLISKDSRLTSSALQTVGSKGYDGFAISIVK